MKSTRYRIHKLTSHGRFVVTENTEDPLSPYRATEPISTPWAGTRVGVGSILLLADQTAEKMLAQGGIEALENVNLRPWREADEEKRAARWEAKLSRKLSGSAVS